MKLLKYVSALFAVLLFVAVWAPQAALAQDDDDDALDELTDDADDTMNSDDGTMDSDDGTMDSDDGTMDSDPAETADDSMAMMKGSSTGKAMKRRLVLPKGQVYLQGFVEINLSNNGGFFKPISIQPDIWYGYTNELTFGLVHSTRALSGFLVGPVPGGGVCLGSTKANMNDSFIPCSRGLYSTTGLLARYHVLDSPVILALDGGLIFTDLSPFVMSLKLGVSGEWSDDKLHVLFGANLGLGLTKRDEGNKEILNLPIGVMYDVMPKLTAGIQTGFRIPFSEASKNYSIPLGFGGRYVVSPKLTIDASFTFPLLLGGDAVRGKLNARVLTLGAAYVL